MSRFPPVIEKIPEVIPHAWGVGVLVTVGVGEGGVKMGRTAVPGVRVVAATGDGTTVRVARDLLMPRLHPVTRINALINRIAPLCCDRPLSLLFLA